jgi:SOS response regulatory protein OraA/RecX
LSTWKNRRRKQSEEALQRVSEVKALDDDEFANTKKRSGHPNRKVVFTGKKWF